MNHRPGFLLSCEVCYRKDNALQTPFLAARALIGSVSFTKLFHFLQSFCWPHCHSVLMFPCAPVLTPSGRLKRGAADKPPPGGFSAWAFPIHHCPKCAISFVLSPLQTHFIKIGVQAPNLTSCLLLSKQEVPGDHQSSTEPQISRLSGTLCTLQEVHRVNK